MGVEGSIDGLIEIRKKRNERKERVQRRDVRYDKEGRKEGEKMSNTEIDMRLVQLRSINKMREKKKRNQTEID